MNQENNGIITLIIVALTIWGGISLYNKKDQDPEIQYIQPSSHTSGSYSNSSTSKDCTEPENPYGEGSGHYAGFEWGQNGNSCGGNSNSFIEGCQEYEQQESSYNQCLNS